MHYPQRTAINRGKLSAPLRYLTAYQSIQNTGFVLDFGCGRGGDFFYLEENKKDLNIDPYAWDPNFLLLYHSGCEERKNSCPWVKPSFNTILCTYVLNVLPPDERKQTIQHVQSLLYPGGSAYFTVRGPKDKISGKTFEDGVITSKNTFQRLYTAKQLQEEIPGSTIVFNKPNFVTVQITNNIPN